MGDIFEVGENDFEEKVVKKSMEKPVVVDFWAPWCMPCRILSPILEKVVGEYRGKILLAKVNVDENRKLALVYMITSIPAVKLFVKGRVADEFVGVFPESRIREWLRKNLGEIR